MNKPFNQSEQENFNLNTKFHQRSDFEMIKLEREMQQEKLRQQANEISRLQALTDNVEQKLITEKRNFEKNYMKYKWQNMMNLKRIENILNK